MRPPPYIGISAPMALDDTAALTQLYASLPVHPDRQLALGVLASTKTLAGLPNRHPAKYLPREKLGAPFALPGVERSWVLCLVHVSADDDRGLADLLIGAQVYAEMDGAVCDGVQVNVVWPAPSALLTYRRFRPSARVVLQIGPVALAQILAPNQRPRVSGVQKVAHVIYPYLRDGAITDVLLDGSAGTGTALDRPNLVPIVAYLAERFPDLGIGVAGGLCAETLPALASLLQAYPFLSLDAEERLQRAAGGLDLSACARYLDAARSILSAEGGA